MTEETDATETETVAIQHEYLTTADFARRAARTYTAFAFARTATMALSLVLIIIGIGCLVWAIGSQSGSLLSASILYFLLPPATALIIYARTRAGTAKRLPPGARIAIGLGASAMRIDGPLGSSTVSYRSYTRAHRVGNFVFLRLLGVRAYSILPRELFPGDDFERLRDSIARANS